jgi:4-hydroxy-4-methyl-2-oxoglutarate aldolase
MDNLPRLANNPERFAWIRHHLHGPAVCDILDSLGYRDQAMHQRLRPLDPANCTIVGRARTLRWMEPDYVVQSDPYGLEIEALDSLKLACCKVAVDACVLSSPIYCAGSGGVS